MIKLKKLLEQNDLLVGEVPFGDRDNQPGTEEFFDEYDIPEEPNTQAENDLYHYLIYYTGDEGQGSSNTKIETTLKKLFAYKKKYPYMLDPNYNTSFDFAWRGSSMSVETLRSYGIDIEHIRQETIELDHDQQREWTTSNTIKGPITINPRGDRGFFSFSLMDQVAEGFIENPAYDLEELEDQERIPVLLGVRNTSRDLLFNPEFISSISGMSEEEVFYIGREIIVDEIRIYPYWLVEEY
jgi:hypothetical protein